MTIPVVDIFAGPGGLSEGFSSFAEDVCRFKVVLSIEKDTWAHRTLELRAFYRQFEPGAAPDEYYMYLAGQISRLELFLMYPDEARRASTEAWHATLGAVTDEEVDKRISSALSEYPGSEWILIGGPPCQAYSLAGRARMNEQRLAQDSRHTLYRHYLKILARHRPAVFIMENVKGMLSSRYNGQPIFSRILSDLSDPIVALNEDETLSITVDHARYQIYSLVSSQIIPGTLKPGEYVIRAEDYGVPQTRHRVILMGIREDIVPGTTHSLQPQPRVTIDQVIGDLPRLRSDLSDKAKKEAGGNLGWLEAINEGIARGIFRGVDEKVNRSIAEAVDALNNEMPTASDPSKDNTTGPAVLRDWFLDPGLRGVCNHEARTHMISDLHRYLFAAVYAKVHGFTPKLRHYPAELLPDHKNVEQARNSTSYFSDRFRVQLREQPSSTITSHIRKDGHYFIHYDPTQCRSLTVREAARLQTFPDNYFFEGNRTQQYKQVGNAVPPLLARQIAGIVAGVLEDHRRSQLERITAGDNELEVVD